MAGRLIHVDLSRDKKTLTVRIAIVAGRKKSQDHIFATADKVPYNEAEFMSLLSWCDNVSKKGFNENRLWITYYDHKLKDTVDIIYQKDPEKGKLKMVYK